MTFEQFSILAKTMKVVYTSDKFLPDQDAIKVWFAILKDMDYKLATAAVQMHIETSTLPPTIADIRNKAADIVDRDSRMSDMEAWSLVRSAISDSAYHSQEQFARLPETVQKAVGSPQNLHEWSQMDMETVGSVIHSNFLRNYRVVVERQREMQQLSPNMRNLLADIVEQTKRLGVGD